jgi:RNA polymerase sigma-70 factor (ECF subfamily)
VQNDAIAEDLAQETWLAVLQGLSRFEGRSSLKTWIFTILTNKAKTRSQRENRSFVFSDLENSVFESPTVDSERFKDQSAGKLAHHWAVEPASWAAIPEDKILSQETLDLVRQTIDGLPENQQAVITLRDIEELSSQEICNILGISETNQRVLLHRARARVRRALEDYLLLEP